MAHITESGATPDARTALAGARIVDGGGRQADLVSVEQEGGAHDAHAWLRLDDGAQVRVPVSLLALQPDGVYRLPFAFAPAGADGPLRITLPVRQEELQVGKRMVDTGRGVRVHKTVSEQERIIDEPLLREQLVVEHVPVGRVVDEASPPQARYEGDTLVVPVLEEVLVVQKQLLLREEVRITRERHQASAPRTVRLRTEQAAVERFDEKGQA